MRRLRVRRSTFSAQNRQMKLAPGEPSLRLAYGHSMAQPPAELLVQRGSGDQQRVLAVNESGSQIAQLWPPYAATVIRRREQILFKTAVTDGEIGAARALLEAVHDQGAAKHGMFLCLYSVSPDHCRSLLGVAQIGEYYHTHFPGRASFGTRILGRNYDHFSRGEVIKRIPLAAAKRFAIHPDEQGRRLGQLLAAHTLKVARDYRWPSARVVEVSRYMPEDQYFELCGESRRDFLTRSGYVPVPLNRWGVRGGLHGHRTQKLSSRRIAGYYYADLSDKPRTRSIERALLSWE